MYAPDHLPPTRARQAPGTRPSWSCPPSPPLPWWGNILRLRPSTGPLPLCETVTQSPNQRTPGLSPLSGWTVAASPRTSPLHHAAPLQQPRSQFPLSPRHSWIHPTLQASACQQSTGPIDVQSPGLLQTSTYPPGGQTPPSGPGNQGPSQVDQGPSCNATNDTSTCLQILL